MRVAHFVRVAIPLMACATVWTQEGSGTPEDTLNLEEAIQLALADSPGLRAETFRLNAFEADTDQARRRPNPEMEFEIEEIDAGVDRSGLDSAEYSIRLGQTLELGDKRDKRVAAAELDALMQQQALEQQRIEVACDTKEAFFNALAAQEMSSLAKSRVHLAREVLRVIQARVQAGESSPLDAVKAQIELDRQALELEKAERNLDTALAALAIHCGLETPLTGVSGSLNPGQVSLPTRDELMAASESSPEVIQWLTLTRKKQALLQLERSQRIPDVTIRAGIHRFKETDQTGFSVGLGLPLRVFDRHQGRIERSAQELAIAEQELLDGKRQVRTQATRLLNQLQAELRVIGLLSEEMIPAAEQVFQSSTTGYREGKFGYLDVLAAQHRLVETQADLINASKSYRDAEVQLQRRFGISLSAILTESRGK